MEEVEGGGEPAVEEFFFFVSFHKEIQPAAGSAVYGLDAEQVVKRMFGEEGFVVETFQGADDIAGKRNGDFKISSLVFPFSERRSESLVSCTPKSGVLG